ncbi:MAG: hypothetical protein A2Y25_07430 [Candidatus Melainabacteria bacterium GWF2_37_15]|nr:MAG: hypothetical protein A2Y25_07430 [Candidatus Melainabacteria bacterium GWF2_37_15]
MAEGVGTDFLSNIHKFLGNVRTADQRADGRVGNIFAAPELAEHYGDFLNYGGDKDMEALSLFSGILVRDGKDGNFDLKQGMTPILIERANGIPDIGSILNPEEQGIISNVLQHPGRLQGEGLSPEQSVLLLLSLLKDQRTSNAYNDYMGTAKETGRFQGNKPGFIPQLGSLGQADASYKSGQGIDSKYNNIASKDTKAMVERAAQEYGNDPNLLMAVMGAESGGNPNAVSPRGAQGRMQIMPDTAGDLAREMGTTQQQVLNDPETNIRASSLYLKKLRNMFGGDVKLALAAYNAGPGAVKKHGGIPPYRETQNYVAKVTNNYNKMG